MSMQEHGVPDHWICIRCRLDGRGEVINHAMDYNLPAIYCDVCNCSYWDQRPIRQAQMDFAVYNWRVCFKKAEDCKEAYQSVLRIDFDTVKEYHDEMRKHSAECQVWLCKAKEARTTWQTSTRLSPNDVRLL